ncbi:hypothetical protein ABEB36_012052 [Hypothenemus hampei]|uniref:Glutamate dehydrogenase n=1 Tax=Hypothenemus hampei TaxID=57062 RepID=A0ABD1E9W4_HYPHA
MVLKHFARIEYEIPERYRNSFYLANAALFDSTNWFLHKAYEATFPYLKNTFRHHRKQQMASDMKIHEKLENLIDSLDQCNSIIDVRFPVQKENGKLEIVRGFRAHYGETVRKSPCLGGLRIREDITRDQMKALALLSFMKSSCLGTGLSGAMGGIKIDPKMYSENELKTIIDTYVSQLRIKGYCNHTDVVHPDMNTGEREMTWIHQAFATYSGQSINATSTGKSIEYGGIKNYDKATAMGAFKALDYFLNNGEVMLKTGCIKAGLKNKRFILQGLGKVGKPLGLMLIEAGAICVGVKEEDAYLYHSDGIDLNELYKYKEEHGSIENYGLSKTEYPESIFTQDCDILVLAACQKSLECRIARDIKARIVLEAADCPVTPTAHKILTTKSKLIVPDIYACAGANVISYFEYLRNLHQTGTLPENMLRFSTDIYEEVFQNMDQEQQTVTGVGGSQTQYNMFLPLDSSFTKNAIDCTFTAVGEEIFDNLKTFKLGLDMRTAAYSVAIQNNFKSIFEENKLI